MLRIKKGYYEHNHFPWYGLVMQRKRQYYPFIIKGWRRGNPHFSFLLTRKQSARFTGTGPPQTLCLSSTKAGTYYALGHNRPFCWPYGSYPKLTNINQVVHFEELDAFNNWLKNWVNWASIINFATKILCYVFFVPYLLCIYTKMWFAM